MQRRFHLLVLGAFLTCGALSQAAHADDGDWPMYNHDVAGTRHNRAEWRLSPRTVPHLRELWSVTTPGAVTGTPVVVDDQVYVGDWSGGFYKLRASDGHTVWKAQVLAPISASALVQENRVIFGDQSGFIYGLDRNTGGRRWRISPNPHPVAAIFGSPTPIGRYVAIGISSNEEQAAATPGYPCCTFRGSVVLLDPSDGRVLWQTYFISERESAAGSAGASVWNTPTYDEDLDLIFVGTSNNYRQPATSRSDAFIALDPRTGAIRWESQRVVGDVSNFTIEWHDGIDAGIGDSLQIYRLPNGRKVVGAGSKNGVYWVLDAETGQELHERQIQIGGSLGGLFADSAVAYGLVFANGIDWLDPFDFSTLPNGGLLTAFTSDTRSVLWQKRTPQSVNQSGVAVANTVVYFSSCNPGTGDRLANDSGTLYALSALTGSTLAAMPMGDCALSGPSVSNGRVFAGTGNMFQFATIPPGRIIAFGLGPWE
jgi:polyvinyl alcohol dehydrogenase (cytochrome)